VKYLCEGYQVSERHACSVLQVSLATYRSCSHLNQWPELRLRMREIAQARVRYGYRKIRVLLNRLSWLISWPTAGGSAR